ncbi:hypothetical protein X765_20610 [Mesorhizobium sp. LSHC440B00]|nr:hypothetical protein X765_20610 [Mesorhizobium sp. LSHC440B00]ESX30069.1 hypothetical protein X763_29565 [Mesorhizobium sp. LSHC432A00]ESX31230.1 hypothetical protein X764_30540 [Mesorhizobium sp. LSHC440A00]
MLSAGQIERLEVAGDLTGDGAHQRAGIEANGRTSRFTSRMTHGWQRFFAMSADVVKRLGSVLALVCFTSAGVQSQGLPAIGTPLSGPYLGQWDYLPVESPDREAAAIVAVRPGLVWLATNGRIMSLVDQQRVRPLALPDPSTTCAEQAGLQISSAIMSHDAIALDEGRILVSSEWQEVFLAAGSNLTKLTPACERSRGTYSFAKLPDGRLVLGTTEYRGDPEGELTLLTELEKLVAAKPTVVRGVDRLVVSGGHLFAATEGGAVLTVDPDTGATKPLANVPIQFLKDVQPTPDGQLLVAGVGEGENGGCFRLNPVSPSKPERFYAGNCFALLQPYGKQIWASIDTGIYRFNGLAWQSVYRNDASGIGQASKFAFDDARNLWVSTNLGLWRHYDFVEDVPLVVDDVAVTETIDSLAAGPDGGVYVGLQNGSVLSFKDGATVPLLAGRQGEPGSAYDAGPLFAEDSKGAVWTLTNAGLFRDLGTAVAQAGPPLPSDSSRAPSSFAICPNGAIFAGQSWTSDVLMLVEGRWRSIHGLPVYVGGNAVADLKCDRNNRLWAIGVTSVSLRLSDGTWIDSDEIPIRNGGKINLFGALAIDETNDTVTAWGSWGAPVELRLEAGHLVSSEPIKVSGADPYIFYKAQRLPDGRQIVLSDLGLLLADNRGLKRFGLLDEHLQLSAKAYIASAGTSPVPIQYIAVGSTLFRVVIPNIPPTLALRTTITDPLPHASIRLDFDAQVPVGPRLASHLQIEITPSVDGQQEHSVFDQIPPSPVTLADLQDRQNYTATARLFDVAGNASEPLSSHFRYAMPLYENPWVAAAIGIAAILLVVLVISRRGPTEFILRRLSGRKWRLATAFPDRTLEISVTDNGLMSELGKRGASLKLAARWLGNLSPELQGLRGRIREMSDHVTTTNSPEQLRSFSKQLIQMRGSIDALSTERIGFSLRTQEPSSLQLVVDRTLGDLPWDLLTGPNELPVNVQCSVSRVIVADVIPQAPRIDGALRAFVYAAPAGQTIPPGWETERDEIALTMRRVGISTVIVGHVGMSKQEFLEQLAAADLVHFVGHGELDQQGTARLVLNDRDRVSSDEIAETLQRSPRKPSVIILNACGTLEERSDQGGAALAGLATPFIVQGAVVLGTQWPVQSQFATSFAQYFYAGALPPPNSLLWKWLRRQPLAGLSVAEAVMNARMKLFADSPSTDPTWSAYVLFGDVTARLALE